MARRPAPPSPSPKSSAATSSGAKNPASKADRTSKKAASAASAPRVDVREWASGIRLSMFSVIMLSLVILGAWVLVPTLGTYIDQRQKIAALEESVQVSEDQIAALQAEQKRWEDPAYIRTQARERLYYVQPGEVVYLIDDDLDETELPPEQKPVSDELEQTRSDWMTQLLRSVTASGLAQNAVVAP